MCQKFVQKKKNKKKNKNFQKKKTRKSSYSYCSMEIKRHVPVTQVDLVFHSTQWYADVPPELTLPVLKSLGMDTCSDVMG